MRTASLALVLVLGCKVDEPTKKPTAPEQAAKAPANAVPPPAQPTPPPPVEASPDPTPAPNEEPEGPYAEAMVRALEARKRNDAKAAEAAYRDALRHRAKDAIALAGLAEVLFAQKKHADAIEQIEVAYEVKPDAPEVRWAFGLIMLENRKRTEDAVAAWEALAKDTPEYAAQLQVPARLQAIKKYSKGMPHGAGKQGDKASH